MIWGISRYRKVGRGARCIKVGNGPLKLNNFQLIILILLSWSTAGRLSLSKTWRAKLKISTLNLKITTKKLIVWLFFGRGEDVQERRYNYSTYSDIPIKYPGIVSPSSMTSSDVTR